MREREKEREEERMERKTQKYKTELSLRKKKTHNPPAKLSVSLDRN